MIWFCNPISAGLGVSNEKRDAGDHENRLCGLHMIVYHYVLLWLLYSTG